MAKISNRYWSHFVCWHVNKHGEKITSNKKSKEKGEEASPPSVFATLFIVYRYPFPIIYSQNEKRIIISLLPYLATLALSSLISIDTHNIRSHRRLLLTDQVEERQLLRIESSNKRHMIYEHARALETNPINSDLSESPRKSGEIPDFWV